VLLPPVNTNCDVIRTVKSLRLFSRYFEKLNDSFRDVVENNRDYGTLFLPTNRALKMFFVELNTASEEEAMSKLTNVLLNKHVIRSKPLVILPNDLGEEREFQFGINEDDEKAKQTLVLFRDGHGSDSEFKIKNFNASLIQINLITRNGVIHLVDRVFNEESSSSNTTRDLMVSKKKWKALLKRWESHRT